MKKGKMNGIMFYDDDDDDSKLGKTKKEHRGVKKHGTNKYKKGKDEWNLVTEAQINDGGRIVF
jgi:hypothetical protein